MMDDGLQFKNGLGTSVQYFSDAGFQIEMFWKQASTDYFTGS